MFLVKTYLDKSKIRGIGLFADEFIPKGTLIWKFNYLLASFSISSSTIFLAFSKSSFDSFLSLKDS